MTKLPDIIIIPAMSYRIRVNYRTFNTISSKTVEVIAHSIDEAFAKASAKVSGATRHVDGGEMVGQPIAVGG